MSEEDEGEKEHEPSQRRLDEARKRGEIPRSPDLVTAATYGGLLLAGGVFGASALQQAGEAASVLLGQADRLAPMLMKGGATPFGGIMTAFLAPLTPFLILPGLAALIFLLASGTLLFTPENLAPKLSRISPLATAKHKFGSDGLFEFGKSFVKLCMIAGLLFVFLEARAGEILTTIHLTPTIATMVLLRILIEFLFVILLIALVFGGIDFLWQRSAFLRKHRMSRKDLMDEMKDSEGDPHFKAHRRQRAQEIATNRMLTDVATADVIIVNPTHYSVALKWSRADKTAPVCVAKGVDEIAARIRERAAIAGVPIHADPPTARALHASVEIGQEIHPDHYRAVAAAIRFSEAMRRKAKARR